MTKVNFLFEKVLDYVNEGYEKQSPDDKNFGL